MGEQKIETLVKGGEATAAPPLAPALAPLGINVGNVVNKINKKTQNFKGIEVPVTVTVDTKTKAFGIEVGTPPVSSLIKNELDLEKGSEKAGEETIADIKIEQVIKIAKMKEDQILGINLKNKIKEIIGTCGSMGILVERKKPKKAIEDVEKGDYNKKIREEKTELTEEEKKELKREKKKLKEKIKKEHEEMKKKGKEILETMKEKKKGEIRRAMREEEISDDIIEELVPHKTIEKTPRPEGS